MWKNRLTEWKMDEATVNRSQKNTKPNVWDIYGFGHKHEVVMMTPKLVL